MRSPARGSNFQTEAAHRRRDHDRPATKPHSGGFTLVEVVVVIGIILFLVGLTLSVSVAVVERSEIQQTEHVLRLLDMAVGEWELTAGRKLSWGNDGDPTGSVYDVHPSPCTLEVFVISEVLDTITTTSAARSIIGQIDAEFVHTYEPGPPYPPWIDEPPEQQQQEERFVGSLTILDAWETPVYATHPGRPLNPRLFPQDAPPYQADPDGTIRTYNEQRYGIARNRRMVFVSAGPDRRFGLFQEFGDLPGRDVPEAIRHAQSDNLFSSPVDLP